MNNNPKSNVEHSFIFVAKSLETNLVCELVIALGSVVFLVISRKWSLALVSADGPHVHSFFNLSTMTTKTHANC